jgi:hypothetical protein
LFVALEAVEEAMKFPSLKVAKRAMPASITIAIAEVDTSVGTSFSV